MKNLYALLTALLMAAAGYAQDDTPFFFFSEDFEGDSHAFTMRSRTATNKWYVGTAAAAAGSKSAYISYDGGATNAYNTAYPGIAHMYADVTFPAVNSEKPDFVLSFNWRCVGRRNYDDLRVYLMDTSITLPANYTPNAVARLTLWGKSDWQQAKLALPQSYADSTLRLLFTWENEFGGSSQLAAAVDNVALTASSSWTLKDGTLTIRGEGVMPYYGGISGTRPWDPYLSSIKSVVVAEGVTTLTEAAFSGCDSLTSVTLPSSLTTIGVAAFANCRRLTAITIPEGVATIERSAFSECRSLTTVSLPSSFTAIDDYTFTYCTSLTAITIPNSVTSIGNGAFTGCSSLTSITLPEGVTYIGYDAFSGCKALTSANIPNGVTAIWSRTFYDCSVLASIAISENVTSIGDNAFYNCQKLTSLTLPSSVTTIGARAFDRCYLLAELKAYSLQPAAISTDVFSGVNKSTCTLIVPLESVSLYQAATGWKDFTQPAGVYTCTVTFNAQGGSSVAPKTIAAYYRVAQPVAPTRTGYTFGGWYEEAGCTNAWDFDTYVSNSATLYAKWIPHSYTVTFLAQGDNAEVSSQTQTVEHGSKVEEPATPTRTGYTFLGWYKDIANAWDFSADTVTGNTTLYAMWTLNSYTVTFSSQEGSSVDPQTVEHDSTATQPTAPTRTGYTFGGWYKEEVCTNAWNFAADVVVSDTTLYAKWTINSYTVTFSSQEGSSVTPQGVKYGSAATEPAAPTRTGYTFGGWYKEATCANEWNFAADMVVSDTTLYAKWTINTYTLTITDAANGEIVLKFGAEVVASGASLDSGTVLTLQATSKAGYTFTKWWDGSTEANREFKLQANATIAATFTAVAVESVSLNKTTTSMLVEKTEQLTATVLPANALNKNVAWESSNTAVATVSGAGLVTAHAAGTAAITVTTEDGSKTATCTVTVSVATVAVTGVSLNKSTATLTAGNSEQLTATVLPTNATNQNVTWSSNNNAVATVSEAGIVTAHTAGKATITVKTVDRNKTATCEVTVNAVVVTPTPTPKYTVTIPPATNGAVVVKNGETTVVSGTRLDSGTVLTLTATPNSGYKFTEWWDGGKAANRAFKLQANATIAATFTAVTVTPPPTPKYTVTIAPATNGAVVVKNGADLVTSGATLDSGTVLTLQATSNAGYEFTEWWDGSTAANRNFTLQANVTISATFTAVAVTGVSLNKAAATLTVGGTEQLTATLAPSNAANQNVTWLSNNTGVAMVSSVGLLTAVSAGTAVIFVTTQDGSHTALCTVTVNAATVAATGVSLNQTTATLTVGGTEQLTATVTPSNATNKSVTWSSSNTAVAAVSTAGLVTAKAAGTATITVKTEDGSKTATCKITVTQSSSSTTAVSANELLPLTLYPTVTNGELKVENGEWGGAIASEAKQPQAIEVYNLSGALVAKVPTTGEITSINLSQLPSGTYVVRVGRYAGKVVKR